MHALYDALRLALIELQPGEPGDGVTVDLPVTDAATVAAALADLPFDGVAAAAGALLTHPVAVVGAPVLSGDEQTRQRLRYLDAVTTLLPFGHRARLVASTFAESVGSGAPSRIRLMMTTRPRTGQAVVPWTGTAAAPSRGAAAYRELLRTLVHSARMPMVELVEALAADTTPRRTGDAGSALRSLERLRPLNFTSGPAFDTATGSERAEASRAVPTAAPDTVDLTGQLNRLLAQAAERGPDSLDDLADEVLTLPVGDARSEALVDVLTLSAGRQLAEPLWYRLALASWEGYADAFVRGFELLHQQAGDNEMADRVLTGLIAVVAGGRWQGTELSLERARRLLSTLDRRYRRRAARTRLHLPSRLLPRAGGTPTRRE
jgi:hypothetical protein